jgi:hypothetical protein
MDNKKSTKEEILFKIQLLERNIAKYRYAIHHTHDKEKSKHIVSQIIKHSEEIKELKLLIEE